MGLSHIYDDSSVRFSVLPLCIWKLLLDLGMVFFPGHVIHL